MSSKFDFNEGLSELEEIIGKMESGDLSLEESLNYFEKGIKLHRQCHSALSSAEQRISVLSEEDNYTEKKSLDDI